MKKSRKKSKHVSERNSDSSAKSLGGDGSSGSGKDRDGGIKTEETSDEDEAINYPNQPPIQNGFVVFIHQVNFGSAAKEKRRVVEWISDALKMLDITPEVVTVDNLMEQSIAVCSKPKSPIIKFARPVAENDTGTAKSENGGPSSKAGGKLSKVSPSRRKISANKSKTFGNTSSSGKSKSPQPTREKSLQSTSSRALERKSGRPMKPQAIEDKKQEFGVQMSVLKEKVRNMQKENNNSVWVLLVESRRRCIVDMGKLNSLATRCRFKVRWIAAQAPRSLDQSVFSVVNDVVQTKNLCFPEQMRAIRRRNDSKSKVEKPKKAKTSNKGGKSNTVRVEVLHKTLSKQFNVSSYASFDPNQFMDGGASGMGEDDFQFTGQDSMEDEGEMTNYSNFLAHDATNIILGKSFQQREIRKSFQNDAKALDDAMKRFVNQRHKKQAEAGAETEEQRDTSFDAGLRRLEEGVESNARKDALEENQNPDTNNSGRKNSPGADGRQWKNSSDATSKESEVFKPSSDISRQKEILQAGRNDPGGVSRNKNVLHRFDSSDSNSNESSDDAVALGKLGRERMARLNATVGLALTQSRHGPRTPAMLPGLSCSSTCRTFLKELPRKGWDVNGNDNCDINGKSVVVITRSINDSRECLARILRNLLHMEGIRSFTISVTELLRQPVAVELIENLGKLSRTSSSQDISAGCRRLIQKGLSLRLKEKNSHVIIVDVEDESFVHMWPIYNHSAKLGHKCLLLESSPDGAFEENLEKVLRTIRLRMGQQEITAPPLPEDPSFDMTKTPSSHEIEGQQPNNRRQQSEDDKNNVFGKVSPENSGTVWTVKSVRRIVSESETPSGVATSSNIDSSVVDGRNNNEHEPLLAETPSLLAALQASSPTVPSFYNVNESPVSPNMSACIENPLDFANENISEVLEDCCEKLKSEGGGNILQCGATANVENVPQDQCAEPVEHVVGRDYGNTTVNAHPAPNRASPCASQDDEKTGRTCAPKQSSSSSTIRMRRRSSLKIRSKDRTTDDYKDHNSNRAAHRRTVTETGAAPQTTSDEEEEQELKTKKTVSNLREAMRTAGVAKRSKERVYEGSLLQIHRCETTRLGTGATCSSMPEDDLFCGWVALPRAEANRKEKKSFFVRTQSRLTGFFQRFCTCTRRRVGRTGCKFTLEDSQTEPAPNMTRMHSFH